MAWVILIVTSLLVTSGSSEAEPAGPVKICVPQSLFETCLQMADDANNLQCVEGRDRVDCMRKIQQGEADVCNLDAQEIYVGGVHFNLSIVAIEVLNGDPFKYESVALVARQSNISSPADLRNKRSCHTGVGRNAGWQIPLAVLRKQKLMPEDCRGELYAVTAFFESSCASGNWSPDSLVDAALKRTHPSLCALCQHPEVCSADGEAYNGYEGAIRCLLDGRGDVAFTSMDAVRKLVGKEPEAGDQMELLCPDGGRKAVDDDNPCVWGRRPTNAFVAREDANATRLIDFLQDIVASYPSPDDRPLWFYKVFFSKKDVSDVIPPPSDQRSWGGYLGDFRLTIDKQSDSCEPKELKFCVTSDTGRLKCEDFAKSAYSRRLSPAISCVQTDSKAACMAALQEGNADLFTLDGGDVYRGGRYQGLLPVAAELYGELEASYFAVAVVRNSSDITRLSDLRGRRSCHTGYGRTAGWVVPVGTLLSEREMTVTCNPAEAVAEYFTESCVPGADDPKINPNATRADDLCRVCVGDEDGESRCRAPGERYAGYTGAFRCLAVGAGDVAFVKHTTVPSNTGGKNDAPWARELQASDFMLLCRSGNSDTDDYLNCNLAKVPSHYVMISGSASSELRLDAAYVLTKAVQYFGPDSLRFKLFASYGGVADLLFKNSATGLKAAPLTADYRAVLGEEYFAAAQALDPKLCDN